jgi:hypothetical protein
MRAATFSIGRNGRAVHIGTVVGSIAHALCGRAIGWYVYRPDCANFDAEGKFCVKCWDLAEGIVKIHDIAEPGP